MEGFLKLHRKSLDSRVFADAEIWRLWCWCLMKANWKRGWKHGCEIRPGQFITGRSSAAEQLSVSESKWRRQIKKLQEYGCIKVEATNQFTLITVLKWREYQGFESETSEQRPTTDQRPTNERPTSDQRPTTIEEGKEREEPEERKETTATAMREPSSSGGDCEIPADRLRIPDDDAGEPELTWADVNRLLASRGVQYPDRATQNARSRGMTPSGVLELVRSDHKVGDIAKHLIHGTALPKLSKPKSRQTPKAPTLDEIEERIRWEGRQQQRPIEETERLIAEARKKHGKSPPASESSPSVSASLGSRLMAESEKRRAG